MTALLAAATFGMAIAATIPRHSTESLIDAERAFSALSVKSGMRTAFLANLADDAVMFRPGPIDARKSWLARPDESGILEWGPEFVELSGAEDVGFSVGPWQYRESTGAEPAAYGHFVTVWRRDERGDWKVVLDCGGSHPDPGHSPHEVQLRMGPVHVAPDSNEWQRPLLEAGAGTYRGGSGVAAGSGGVGVGVGGGGLGFGIGYYENSVRTRYDYEIRRTAHDKNLMMNADRAIGWTARNKGWPAAYRKVSAGDLCLLREGAAPVLGPDAAIAAVSARSRDITWLYMNNGIAKSWDLGWSSGLAIERVKGKSRPDTSAFVHLWRLDEEREWRLVTDWEGPFAKR
jgi:ketosteroid isomerase-like protein